MDSKPSLLKGRVRSHIFLEAEAIALLHFYMNLYTYKKNTTDYEIFGIYITCMYVELDKCPVHHLIR